MAVKKKQTSKTVKREVAKGKIFVTATFNNTLVTITDEEGKTLAWGSSGRAGFKGTRKATPYAATTAVETVVKKVRDEMGMKDVSIYLRGPGPGRDAALRAIRGAGLRMSLIADVTPMPFNGPRARKRRRV